MNMIDAVMSQPAIYRLWMAPFARDKFAPILKYNDLGEVRRVLDVGCGPGTNTSLFKKADYLGIDLNPRYIQSARQRHSRRFLNVDAAEFVASPGERFDFILVNSFLHHLNTPTARRILLNLRGLLNPDGHIHIVELVLPRSASVARFLATADRGKFARPLEEWEDLFSAIFSPAVFEPYSLRLCRVPLWHAVYFKGGAKRE